MGLIPDDNCHVCFHAPHPDVVCVNVDLDPGGWMTGCGCATYVSRQQRGERLVVFEPSGEDTNRLARIQRFAAIVEDIVGDWSLVREDWKYAIAKAINEMVLEELPAVELEAYNRGYVGGIADGMEQAAAAGMSPRGRQAVTDFLRAMGSDETSRERAVLANPAEPHVHSEHAAHGPTSDLPARDEPINWQAINDALDALDAAIDDTHPEGDGCDICRAADELRDAIELPSLPVPRSRA